LVFEKRCQGFRSNNAAGQPRPRRMSANLTAPHSDKRGGHIRPLPGAAWPNQSDRAHAPAGPRHPANPRRSAARKPAPVFICCVIVKPICSLPDEKKMIAGFLQAASKPSRTPVRKCRVGWHPTLRSPPVNGIKNCLRAEDGEQSSPVDEV